MLLDSRIQDAIETSLTIHLALWTDDPAPSAEKIRKHVSNVFLDFIRCSKDWADKKGTPLAPKVLIAALAHQRAWQLGNPESTRYTQGCRNNLSDPCDVNAMLADVYQTMSDQIAISMGEDDEETNMGGRCNDVG
jgi:hypothetical protein